RQRPGQGCGPDRPSATSIRFPDPARSRGRSGETLPLTGVRSPGVSSGATIHATAAAPRAAWIDLLGRAVNPSIYLHPDLAGDDGAVIYTRSDDAGLGALAVLAPRRVRLSRLPGLRDVLVLDGRRLVGDRVLGAGDDADAAGFLDQATAMLERGLAECLQLEDVEVGSPLWRQAIALSRSGRARLLQPSAPQPHWWIRFPRARADYWRH